MRWWPLQRSPFDMAKRVVMWAVSGLTILSGYALAKLEPFADATMLPLTAVDQAIPLVPETIWIYGSGTMTCLLGWLMVPDRLSARRTTTVSSARRERSKAWRGWPISRRTKLVASTTLFTGRAPAARSRARSQSGEGPIVTPRITAPR